MLNRLSISDQIKLLNNNEITSTELIESYLNEINNRDKDINAYITVTSDSALEKAESIDESRKKGEKLKSLAGIPGGIKDNICTKGILTTCASKLLCNFIPTYNATVIDRLENSDYIMLGKLNMDEFGIGGGGEYSYFGPTANPHDIKYVAGGSSSGSAASVAAFECAFSLGTDTGGSVLKPAAYCGVVGMKPTFGTISRYGMVGFAPSCEQIGIITRNIEDNAIVLNTVAGYDKKDSVSVNKGEVDYTEEIGKDIKGLKIAIPKELMETGIIHLPVRKAFDKAIDIFKSLGCIVDIISMPSLNYALPAYYILTCSECASQLSKFDGVRYGKRTDSYTTLEEMYKNTRSEGFGNEVKRRIIFGNYVLTENEAGYYKKALKVRTLIKQEYDNAFKDYNLILTPASTKVANLIGEVLSDPADVYRTDMYTAPINLAGLPAISIPCGKNTDHLPIGLLLTGGPFSEKLLYRAGHAFEKERGNI